MAQHRIVGVSSKSGGAFHSGQGAWLGAGVFLALVLIVAGFWRAQHLHNAALAYWEGQLSSVADVTKFAIVEWVRDRESEMRELAALLADHPLLFEASTPTGQTSERTAAAAKLQQYLQLVKKQNQYSAIWVTDPSGRVLLTWNSDSVPETAARDVAIMAAKEGRWQIIGPRSDSGGAPMLIFAFPIRAAGRPAPDPGRACDGAILLTMDPSRFLFPLVSVDSVATRTGEQMLVARLDDQFIILSPLRHPPAKALTIRMPWNTAPEIGRIAIERDNAFGEFTDTRGVPVVALTRHISGKVGLIRQIDQAEAFAAYRVQARTEGFLALSILAIAALAVVAFRRVERASRLREVAASEAQLAGIINAATDAIIACDADLRVTLFNAEAERIFQCTAGDVAGRPLVDFLPERMRGDFLAKVEKFSRSSETVLAFPDSDALTGLRRNGEEFPLDASVSRLEVDGQRILLAIMRDITPRKLSEELLRKTEEKYRRLFEESRDVVFISSTEGRILDINPAGVELFGYESKEELMKIDIAETLYCNPQDRQEVLRAHETRGFVKDYEIASRRKDGRKVVVLETSNAVRDESGRIVAYRGILRDITEQKMLESQLLQAQKMEAIGQLAGGIAHDFNNILTAILGYSELLLSDCPPSFPHRRDIEEIAKSATRAAALTRQLLAFSRRQVMQPRVLDLNSLVADMNKMLGRLITESIELCTVLDPGLIRIKADPAQIEQVILNLVVNARDAMPEGGKLTIQTANVDLTEALPAQPLNVPPGQYVKVSVSDTGHGIAPEVQARIFEPFFSTKEIGKGTGLGLSTVYGIVKQSGGFITVQSAIGSGTAFCIYLPRSAAPVTAAELPEEPTISFNGSETILLVEDEDSVRSLTRDILVRSGYKVLEATNGEEAVAVTRSSKDPIQMMITDVVMPGMGGKELAQQIRAIRPETRVLYVSGYAQVVSGKDSAFQAGKTLLAKPFTPMDLVRMVRRILDENRTPTDTDPHGSA